MSERGEAQAHSDCLRLLTIRPRTRYELEKNLLGKGFDDLVVESVLHRLVACGLVDDAAFAATWVESRATGRGLGRRALRAELLRKGVEKERADAAVAALRPESELQVARELAVRRLRSMTGLGADVRRRRILALLARRGFDEAVAWDALRAAESADPTGAVGQGPSTAEGSA